MSKPFCIRKQLNLVFFKVYAELKAEASRSFLGLLWWLIEPVLYLGAFYVLFVLVLQHGGVNFVPGFLCGIVVWKLFDAGVKSGGNALSANAILLQQVYIPKYILPLSAVLGVTLRFLPVFAVLCLFLLFYTGGVASAWLWSIPLILLQVFLVFSLAVLVSSIIPFVPDLRVAIDNGMMFLFFISGVFFDVSAVGEPVKSILMLNPMAVMISAYRDVLLLNSAPDFWSLAAVFAFSISVLVVGFIFLNRWDRQYAKARF